MPDCNCTDYLLVNGRNCNCTAEGSGRPPLTQQYSGRSRALKLLRGGGPTGSMDKPAVRRPLTQTSQAQEPVFPLFCLNC